MKLLIINGPNLNLVGIRNPEVYGNKSLNEYLDELQAEYQFEVFQTNIEGEIIDKLHEAQKENYEGIVINAGGYTHTSVSIADAIEAISTPVMEVHISNIFSREEFRHTSLIAPHCVGHISGFGLLSYELALKAFLSISKQVP
ncbi:MAG: type II 3-dehydroquinate dehydratase [Flavobacteriales bacterium]